MASVVHINNDLLFHANLLTNEYLLMGQFLQPDLDKPKSTERGDW